jgi:alkanesulfonate monooxygenase SsuD/methylene tetrahydromethanopterin reductase-like flavin-dependent oxidoreductase (luciferase family)
MMVFFYGESLADIDLDCWTILSNLSAVTDKIKLGPVITYLFPQYRSIVLLAKQAVTLQEISNGRLEFRTGAGATPKWSLQWWHPHGIKYPNNAERVRVLKEGIPLLHRLWKTSDGNNEPSVYFTGNYFKLNCIFEETKQNYPHNNCGKEEKDHANSSQIRRCVGVILYYS